MALEFSAVSFADNSSNEFTGPRTDAPQGVWTSRICWRKDNRILLDDPVDERAFGSLLLSPQGAVGMVQDEKSGMALHGLVTRGL